MNEYRLMQAEKHKRQLQQQQQQQQQNAANLPKEAAATSASSLNQSTSIDIEEDSMDVDGDMPMAISTPPTQASKTSSAAEEAERQRQQRQRQEEEDAALARVLSNGSPILPPSSPSFANNNRWMQHESDDDLIDIDFLPLPLQGASTPAKSSSTADEELAKRLAQEEEDRRFAERLARTSTPVGPNRAPTSTARTASKFSSLYSDSPNRSSDRSFDATSDLTFSPPPADLKRRASAKISSAPSSSAISRAPTAVIDLTNPPPAKRPKSPSPPIAPTELTEPDTHSRSSWLGRFRRRSSERTRSSDGTTASFTVNAPTARQPQRTNSSGSDLGANFVLVDSDDEDFHPGAGAGQAVVDTSNDEALAMLMQQEMEASRGGLSSSRGLRRSSSGRRRRGGSTGETEDERLARMLQEQEYNGGHASDAWVDPRLFGDEDRLAALDEAIGSHGVLIDTIRRLGRRAGRRGVIEEPIDPTIFGLTQGFIGRGGGGSERMRVGGQNIDLNSYEDLLKLDEINGVVKRGLSKTQIRSLPVVPFHKGSKSEDDCKCYVCFDQFNEGENVMMLPCLHAYHPNCIAEWIEKDKRCPVCNIEVKL